MEAVTLYDLLRDSYDRGYHQGFEAVEDKVIKNLHEQLATLDPRNHLEFVSVRGMLDGIKRVRAAREEVLEPQSADPAVNLEKNNNGRRK